MRISSLFLTFGLCWLLLDSHAASAQVSVRIGRGYAPRRVYYAPRPVYPRPVYYAPPPPVVYLGPPPPVVVVPAPYYAPRRVYYAPRPAVRYRGRGHYGRRW